MPRQRPEQPLSLEHVTHMARQTLLRDGVHTPTLLVEGTAGHMTGFAIEDLPATHHERGQLLFQMGWMLGQTSQLGLPLQVFLITEAWLSMLDKNEEPTTSPALDPQRREVLIIAGLKVLTKTHSLAILAMIRHAEKLVEVRELERQTGEKVYSPLTEAWVAGYLLGMGQATRPPQH